MNSVMSKIFDNADEEDQIPKWSARIKDILVSSDLSYLWQVQVHTDYLYCKEELKTKCYKNFLEKWREEVRSNSQCEFYNLINRIMISYFTY